MQFQLFSSTQKPNLACDVYSFGILLWEIVTHKVPYEGMGIEAILTQVIKENKVIITVLRHMKFTFQENIFSALLFHHRALNS